MSAAERIKADMAVARERFSNVSNLDGDHELVTFTINGQEFSVALPDVYGSSCEVYGPDDIELSCGGSVIEIIAMVLKHLQGQESSCYDDASLPMPSLCRTGSAESQESSCLAALDGEWSPLCQDVVDGDDFGMLKAEIFELQAFGIQSTIDGNIFSSASVTLSMPIPESVSRCAAEAWGLNRDQPLRFSFALNDGHYRRSTTQRLQATAWQEKTTAGYVTLDASVQLQNIIRVFWSQLCGVTVGSPPCEGMQEAPRHLVEKKETILEEAKAQPGVLLPLAAYLRQRLPCLHEYCVICDEPLLFPPLLRPTVCTRMLCSYSARAYGTAVTGEFSGQNASLELWDLLVAMAICAGRMDAERMKILFGDGHFPMLFLPQSSSPAFEANEGGFQNLRRLLNELYSYRSRQVGIHGIFWLNQPFGKECSEPLLAPLLGWIWDSNRSYLLALREEDRIDALRTPYQYLLLSAPPEMERAFQDLKAKYGSEFCFHGSIPANWHCILRQGLKNASGTELMTAGQALGSGIYLARSSGTSAGYCGGVHTRASRSTPSGPAEVPREVTGQRTHDPDTLVMLAICEVALVPTLRVNADIWVCPEEAAVVTRFFLVYSGQCVPLIQLNEPGVTSMLRDLARKLTG